METVGSLVAERAHRSPAAPAIRGIGRDALTYADLARHVDGVVAALHRAGVGRDERVAVVLRGGPEMATACLAVASAAACAPLNPEYKAPELGRLLAALDVRLLLVDPGLRSPAASVARGLSIPVLEVRPAEGSPAGFFELSGAARARGPRGRRSQRGAAGPAGRRDVALVLHTSGTTAQPKIVPLTHANVLGAAAGVARSLALGPGDVALDMLPMFHVGGFVDLVLAPLVAGGSTVCAANFTLGGFFECLEALRPTWFQGVPTMLREIAQHVAASGARAAPSSLRLVRSVSAALPAGVLADVERALGVPVIEIYGMTETSGLIASNPLDARKVGSVGVASGPEVAIWDGARLVYEPGRAGEVVVRGASVMAGYQGLAAAEHWTPDGWLRTGDLGYLDADGYLFLTGRIKELINRGGEKVAPREVDDALREHPAVAAVATFALPHEALGEDVAVAVVRAPGAALEREELIAFAAERLAYFKVPRTVLFLEALPRGPGGKLARAALAQELERAERPPSRPSPAAPSDERDAPGAGGLGSPLARLLAALWSQVLGVEVARADADFFDLGGDSLKAASLVNELEARFGATIYVSAVFDAPRIAAFEAYLEDQYPELVARMLGRDARPAAHPGRRVDERRLAELRRTIGGAPALRTPPARKNRRAVFVLTTPRSGSTLLRVMLGGHPRLFAPPELYLLSFDDLAERRRWFSGSQGFLLEGNVRGLMHLTGADADGARALMARLEEERTPTHDYYRMLQDWAGERTLVDKTPWYALHLENLERAEACFADPIYVHLVRHPYGMLRSFDEAKMAQLWYPRFVDRSETDPLAVPYSETELGEMVWLILHENILRFLERVPARRRHRVRFEDLVTAPERTLRDLCSFLDLEFDPRMLAIHSRDLDRMTDGLHGVSRMIGDTKFHQHEGIAASAADAWKSAYELDFLCDATFALARRLGYAETLADVHGREELVL